MDEIPISEQASVVDGESLLDLAYQPSERLLRAIDRLRFYLKRDAPLYRDYYDFAVDGQPAKFGKMQVYRVLSDICPCLRCSPRRTLCASGATAATTRPRRRSPTCWADGSWPR